MTPAGLAEGSSSIWSASVTLTDIQDTMLGGVEQGGRGVLSACEGRGMISEKIQKKNNRTVHATAEAKRAKRRRTEPSTRERCLHRL